MGDRTALETLLANPEAIKAAGERSLGPLPAHRLHELEKRVLPEFQDTLESQFYVDALERTLTHGTPGIFNTYQDSQFTSMDFKDVLRDLNVDISMDGRGRALDKVFTERLYKVRKARRRNRP